MSCFKSNLHRNERGATVVEILIASLLSVMVLSAALEFYVTQHKNWLMQNTVAEVQQNARACLDEIAGTIRMAGYGLPVGHPAVSIGDDTLTVYFARNGAIDTIRYFITYPDSTNPYLVRHINGTPATYFANDVESITAAQIAPGQFTLELTTRSERPDKEFMGLDGYRRRTLETEVIARNLVY